MPASKGQQAEAAARRERVIALRSAGMKFADIAEQVGLASASHAVTDYKRGMDARHAEQKDVADLAATQELERLDALERAGQTVLGQAQRAGDQWMALRAIDRLTRISVHRSELLGLRAVPESGGNRGERPEDITDDLAERRRRRRAAARR